MDSSSNEMPPLPSRETTSGEDPLRAGRQLGASSLNPPRLHGHYPRPQIRGNTPPDHFTADGPAYSGPWRGNNPTHAVQYRRNPFSRPTGRFYPEGSGSEVLAAHYNPRGNPTPDSFTAGGRHWRGNNRADPVQSSRNPVSRPTGLFYPEWSGSEVLAAHNNPAPQHQMQRFRLPGDTALRPSIHHFQPPMAGHFLSGRQAQPRPPQRGNRPQGNAVSSRRFDRAPLPFQHPPARVSQRPSRQGHNNLQGRAAVADESEGPRVQQLVNELHSVQVREQESWRRLKAIESLQNQRQAKNTDWIRTHSLPDSSPEQLSEPKTGNAGVDDFRK